MPVTMYNTQSKSIQHMITKSGINNQKYETPLTPSFEPLWHPPSPFFTTCFDVFFLKFAGLLSNSEVTEDGAIHQSWQANDQPLEYFIFWHM